MARRVILTDLSVTVLIQCLLALLYSFCLCVMLMLLSRSRARGGSMQHGNRGVRVRLWTEGH